MINMIAEVLSVGAQMLGQLLQCQCVVLIILFFAHNLVNVAANQGLTCFGLRRGNGCFLRFVFTFVDWGGSEYLLMYQFCMTYKTMPMQMKQ